MVSEAKRLVPVDTGGLRDSIKVGVSRNNAGKAAYAAAKFDFASDEEAALAARDANRAAGAQGLSVTVRIQASAPHAGLVEFGSIHNQPQPFMRMAYDHQKNVAVAIIKTALGEEIAKTAKRLEARAKRIAK